MRNGYLIIMLISMMILASNCTKKLDPITPEDPKPTDSITSMDDLVVPETFKYKTDKEISVTINDFKSVKDDGDIKYQIYLYSSSGTTVTANTQGDDGDAIDQSLVLVDMLNNLSAAQITSDPNFTLNMSIPSYYDTLYVVRNDMGNYTSMIVPITSNKMAIQFPQQQYAQKHRSTKDDPTDMLYGVNSLKQMYSINPITGETEMLPNLPSATGGSWACAIDPVAEILYTIGISSPYYLYAYDLNTQVWTQKGAVGYSGPRLGYNVNDGLLYFSFGYWMLLIDPSDGRMISYSRINGLHSTSGGDVCFADNGTMYISSTTGLYKCAFEIGNTITATRLSSENLPNYPNSLTFDQNQELWWATNISGQKGVSFIMDTVTGSYEERWSFPNNYIHDLATMPLDEELIQEVDSDNDGIIDFYDEYPNDGDKAYDTYTPSVYGWGTYAFEDLWPYEGDYDFNDLVLNYRFTHVFNSADLIVESYLDFEIKNIGGSFKNGFGIEMDMDESLIQSVSGSDLTAGIVTLNGKGLEANQDKPVLIVFDDAWGSINSELITIEIDYNTPISAEQFGEFNPFIFINGDRGREVHLSDNPPTNLANLDFFGTGNDNSDPSVGRYYKTDNHLPWAINIIHDFMYLEEKSPIILGYLKFADWAESGGVDYQDWYKDQNGYRNDDYIVY